MDLGKWWRGLESFFKPKNNKKGTSSAKNKQTKNNQPNEEWMKNLPPGVKIKRIEVGPAQIGRLLIYGLLVFWGMSALRQMLVPQTVERVALSRAVEVIKNQEASEVTVMDNEVMIKLKDESKILVTSKEPTTSLTEILQREGVNVQNVNLRVENRNGWRAFWDIMSLLLTIGPVLLILWLVMARSGAGGPGGGVFGFGKSNARIFVKGKQNITFNDVAGVTEAKRDLEEVVDFLKTPEKYRKMGARAPKGVLLIGSAGVGKTLLAKAVAGEANVPFFSMAGSEFMEMLVGVGASRVRDLFATAKKAGKAIIFIDEIDAIGRMRGGGMDGGHSERDQTLNQILVEMDGFEPNTAVVVLAATNRGDLLDPALLRPGRFDRRVVLEMPDLAARREIIKIHARGKPFDETVDWERVARATVGFSGAELENMLNEAAIKAARENNTKIGMADIDEASLKVKLGSEKRRELTDEDKLMTAYHEAGHAIVNHVEELDSVTRISIVSRGMALGFTLVPPKRDMIHQTKSKLIKQMAMAMGGRAAEEIVFGDITTGASSDIQHVTRIARNMVTEWGMSELGPINLGPEIDTTEYGKGWIEPTKVSDTMQSRVDEEVKKLVNTALTKAREILSKNRKKLDEIAKVLVVKETIGEDEFEAMMKPALVKA